MRMIKSSKISNFMLIFIRALFVLIFILKTVGQKYAEHIQVSKDSNHFKSELYEHLFLG